MRPIHHALVLNLHQPVGNIEALLRDEPWAAHEILFAMDRIPRVLWPYEDVARVHLALSGTLLETLASPDFQALTYGIVDSGSMLWHYQNTRLFELLGTGYYHPVLPLIPPADREQQVARWLGLGRHLFWRVGFAGFWPPEMGFSMDMIPLLRRYGYRYVLVDSMHVEPLTPMNWAELRYRPHIARYGEDEIVVVVRDRELSDAQESGTDYDWFKREVNARSGGCDSPPLVTTANDGDNGGWFRNVDHQANFWGAFYTELLDRSRADEQAIRPIHIDDYLNRYGTHGEVVVHTGAWNTGWHDGLGFVQWTGSKAQRDALERLGLASQAVHDARWRAGETHNPDPQLHADLEESLWRVLRAETSCHFFWGEAWLDRCHRDLDEAWEYLHRANARQD